MSDATDRLAEVLVGAEQKGAAALTPFEQNVRRVHVFDVCFRSEGLYGFFTNVRPREVWEETRLALIAVGLPEVAAVLGRAAQECERAETLDHASERITAYFFLDAHDRLIRDMGIDFLAVLRAYVVA